MLPVLRIPECSILVGDDTTSDLAQAAWERLEEVAPDHPLREWRCRVRVAPLKARHIAEGAVYRNDQMGTLAGIRLHSDFFELRPERQTLTLLHEAIHVALFTGECKAWYPESIALDSEFCQHPFDLQQPHRPKLASPEAWPCALALFQWKHEIAAEKFLQLEHPQLGLRRAEYYQEMQEERWKSRRDAALPASLRSFGLLYAVLCAELSSQIADGRLGEGPDRLKAQCRRELEDSTNPELLGVVATLLDVNVRPARVDAGAYRSIFEEVLSSHPPAKSDWPEWADEW